MNVAYYTKYSDWLDNQMFDLNSECNVNNVLDRWVGLRQFLARKDIDFNTYDVYRDFGQVDVWLVDDPTRHGFRFLFTNRISPRKVILMLVEPHVVNPRAWKYLRYYSWFFKVILTWNSELCRKSKRFVRYRFPVKLDMSRYSHYRSNRKRNLCLMMHSNKSSPVRGELYSLRRQVIRYFERRGDNLLDLYGHGWNTEKSHIPFFTSLYKGVALDKRETFSEYHFAFCIDNCKAPGYITYDPFVSMGTGTVPIYKPMPDSLQYVPENTFINYDNFATLDQLVSYLLSLVNTDRYEEYRQSGWQFINSERYYPFTVEKFCKDVYSAIRLLEGHPLSGSDDGARDPL